MRGSSNASPGSDEEPPAAEPGWLAKTAGAGEDQPPRPSLAASLYAGACCFGGIGILAHAQHGSSLLALPPCEATVLIGSFGATAALVFGSPAVPFSQPRNVVGGHAVSALIGIGAYALCGTTAPELACPLAVGGAVVAMQQLRVFHPPSAATALIGAMGSAPIAELGVQYAAVAAAGSAVLCGVGVLVHNLRSGLQYPRYCRRALVSSGYEGHFSQEARNARYGGIKKEPRRAPLALGKKGKLAPEEMAALRAKLEAVSSHGHQPANARRRPVAASGKKKPRGQVRCGGLPAMLAAAAAAGPPPRARPQRRPAERMESEMETQKARDAAQPMLCRPSYKGDAKDRLQDGYRHELRELSTVPNALLRHDARRGHGVGDAGADGGVAAARQRGNGGRRRFEDANCDHIVLYDPYRDPKRGAGGAGDDPALRERLQHMQQLRAQCTPFGCGGNFAGEAGVDGAGSGAAV
eukprot:g6176.t1